MSGDEKVQQSVSEIQGAVERMVVRAALLGRSHQVLAFGMAAAGRAFAAAGMEKEADAVIAALAEANAILEEAKG